MQRRTDLSIFGFLVLVLFWTATQVMASDLNGQMRKGAYSDNSHRQLAQTDSKTAGTPQISKHAGSGIKCVSCHGTGQQQERVTMAKCLQCHGSYEKLAKASSKLDPNPHASHEGQVRCGLCHAEHGKSVLSCKECHVFEMKVP